MARDVKELNAREVVDTIPDLASVGATFSNGPFAGMAVRLGWGGSWSVPDATSVGLAAINGVDLSVSSAAGTFTLERAHATRSSTDEGTRGTALALHMQNQSTSSEQAVFRTLVVMESDERRGVLLPGNLTDSGDGWTDKGAALSVRCPMFDLDFYVLRRVGYYMVECTRGPATLRDFRRISGTARLLLSYLTGLNLDADSCDVVLKGGSVDSVHWYKGRPRNDTMYTPVPVVFPDWIAARNEFGIKDMLGPLAPDVMSRCFETFARHPKLVTPIEYLLRFPEQPLEMRGAMLSVALEALTSHFKGERLIDFRKPLADAQFAALRDPALDLASTLPGWTDDQRRTMSNKIKNLNQPTNADKLRRGFDALGLATDPAEIKAIRERDKYLHRGRLLDPALLENDANAWKDAYRVEMRIYTALNKLLLCYLQYDGPVLDWGNMPIDVYKAHFSWIGGPRADY